MLINYTRTHNIHLTCRKHYNYNNTNPSPPTSLFSLRLYITQKVLVHKFFFFSFITFNNVSTIQHSKQKTPPPSQLVLKFVFLFFFYKFYQRIQTNYIMLILDPTKQLDEAK
ncbi:hypothetical protein BDC45DRAFT_502058 [Circinella umbellata]|nr:hypothetical protein BDC45DRAFT_502058 [Circinella umbellata]